MKPKIQALLLVVMMILPLFVLTARGATVGSPCTLYVHVTVGFLELFQFPVDGTVVAGSDGTQACEAQNPDSPYPAVPCGTTARRSGWIVDAICPY